MMRSIYNGMVYFFKNSGHKPRGPSRRRQEPRTRRATSSSRHIAATTPSTYARASGPAWTLSTARGRYGASVADGWVLAYAKAHGYVVVTHEVFARDSKKKVPMPKVCQAFDIPFVNTFEMLKRMAVRFHWNP
jgi:hypothetical protein